MTRADEGGLRLARHSDALLLEDHALVLAQQGSTGITAGHVIADGGRHMGDFVAVWLALVVLATEPLEGFEEK